MSSGGAANGGRAYNCCDRDRTFSPDGTVYFVLFISKTKLSLADFLSLFFCKKCDRRHQHQDLSYYQDNQVGLAIRMWVRFFKVWLKKAKQSCALFVFSMAIAKCTTNLKPQVIRFKGEQLFLSFFG